MPTTTRFLLAITSLAAVFAVAACDASLSINQGVEATGELVTVPFEVDDFDSIAVQNSFEAHVEVGESVSVEVLVNESVVEDLDVRVRNGELKIGLKNGVSVRNGTLEATIQVPQLDAIEVSGASEADVSGVLGPDLTVELSGASDLIIEGQARSLEFEASGASDADVRLDGVRDVEVDLSGASSLELRSADRVSGEMSGASDMSVPPETTLDVSTSGSSEIVVR